MTVIIKRELLERLDPGCELGCYPICEAKGDADCCAVKRALRTPASGAVEAWRPQAEAPNGCQALVRFPSGEIGVAYKTLNEPPFLQDWRWGIGGERGTQAGWPVDYVPLEAVLAALTSEPKAEGEVGWLVESDDNGPLYHRASGTTRQASDALRFSRREDAEAYIRAHGPNHLSSVLTPAWKAVEHRWG